MKRYLFTIATFSAALLIGLTSCATPTSDTDDDDDQAGVYVIDNLAASEDDSNNVSWQESHWQKIEFPLTVNSAGDVKFDVEIVIDNCPTAGTNPYIRFDDAVFKTASGTNLLSNGEFATNPYSNPLPPDGPNQYNNWLPWNVSFEYRNSGWGSVFTNSDAGYGLGDVDAIKSFAEGGNYTLTIEQTISGVPAGEYTASAYILVGNVKATATIQALPQ